ncbi:hypothetical protein SYK_07010 [Pseudodesulfovibrio nedwellii]|uniref:DUF1351 domain-containing protein n=1 Tax=Pseudodesulfovibrio nedwellii TaxID=2973072 RepID=A0ABM8AXV8_9BACT|nr:DUF1351 domain-containing protein [Pseudodesulfovibrio nedwellii]BDQ36341.1 hypothetical protein SYK_07010 [Pseudodesulfovibrio nedwellii]
MTDIKLETTLPALKFDFDGLMAMANGIKEKYEKLVVREEDVKDIKKVMADLNKTKDAVNAARKEAVKKVSEPIKDFEDKIKQVVKVIADTREVLASQVKKHEEQERQDKKRDVQFLIDDLKSEHNLPDLIVKIEPSWLNKTKTLKSIKAEVEAVILAHMKAEREAAQLEQAKQDRAVVIEQRCEICEKQYGVAISPSTFVRLNDLDIPLIEVNAQIDNAFQMKAATQPARPQVQEPMPTQVATPVQQESPAIPTSPMPPVPPMAQKCICVEIHYAPNKEQAVETALRDLQKICTSVRLVNDVRTAA